MKKAMQKAIDNLVLTKINVSEKDISKIFEKLASVEESLGNKVVKLAQNGDNVNDIQRQILERLDNRVIDLEMRDSKTLQEYNSAAHRLLQLEIKTEKLIANAEEITSQFRMIQKTSEKHTVIAENNQTLELLLTKTRAETETSISK